MSKRLVSKELRGPKSSGSSNNKISGAISPRADRHYDNQANDRSDEDDDANTRGAHLKLAQRHKKIVAGRFKGLRTVEPEEAAPGVLGQLAICFTTNGALPRESCITCQLPDHGWSVLASTSGLPSSSSSSSSFSSSVTRNALLKLPQGNPVPSLKTLWTPQTRTFEFTLLNEAIGSDAPVVILVSGVSTPECATPQGEVLVTAFEKLVVRSNTTPVSTRGGQIIDGPCRFVISKILPGQISGPKRWLPFSCCPGDTSDVSLSFTVNGAIPVGGKILIELPADGWDMNDHPKALLRNAQHHNAVVPAVWTRLQHALEITLTSEPAIPMKSSVTLTIVKVTNPPKETLISGVNCDQSLLAHSHSGRITTLAADGGGVIDGPCKLDVARISELREPDFEIAKAGFDSEDLEKCGNIAVDRVADVLRRCNVHLSDELYQSLVVANFPIRAPMGSSEQQGGEEPSEPSTTTTTTSTTPPKALLLLGPDRITRNEFLNLFASVYAPAYKFGQELRLACGRGQVEKVREWVSRGCDPSAKDGSGWCALHYVADFGHLDVLLMLLELDRQKMTGDVDVEPGAVATNQSAGVQRSRRLDLNARDAHGWTPLMCACANGHTRIVETLLSAGASVSLASSDGRTALHWAAARGMDETLRVLLSVLLSAIASSNGGDAASDGGSLCIDTVDRSGWSALHCAMLHGSPECAQLLIENGANASLKDELQYPAAYYGRDGESSG